MAERSSGSARVDTVLTAVEEAEPHRSDSAGAGRIFFVSHTAAWGGGAEVVLGQLMNAAEELGYQTLLACPDGELPSRLGLGRGRHVTLPNAPLRRSRSPARVFGMLAGWFRHSLVLMRAIRITQPDVVYANSGVAALAGSPACVALRRPLLWHQHDIVPDRRINRLVLRPCASVCASIVAVSGAVATSLTQLGIPRSTIAVLHNAVRSEFFEPLQDKESARSKLGLPADAFVVAMAGRLVPYKGHKLFIEALARLRTDTPNIVGVVAGAVPVYQPPDVDPFPGYERELHALTANLGLEGAVQFTGPLEDLRELLAAADALVVPSVDEPFPLTILEGLAAAVPVIASDSGGHPEAIEDGVSGLLFDSGSAPGLVRVVARLLADGDLAARLSKGGQARATSAFTEAIFRERLAAILTEALSARSS